MSTSNFKPWMSLVILGGMLSMGFLGGCNQNTQKSNAIKGVVHPRGKINAPLQNNLVHQQIQSVKKAMRDSDILFNSFWKVQMNERASFQTAFKSVELILSRHFSAGQLTETLECGADSKGTQVKVNQVTKVPQAPQVPESEREDSIQKTGPKSNQFRSDRQQPARQQPVTYLQSLKINRVSDCRQEQFREIVEITWSSKKKFKMTFRVDEMQNEFGATLQLVGKNVATCEFELMDDGKLDRVSCKGLGQTSNSETIELTDFTYDRKLTTIFVASGNRWKGERKDDMSLQKCEEKNTPCIHVVAEKGSEIVTVYENTITEEQRRQNDRAERERQKQTPPPGQVAPVKPANPEGQQSGEQRPVNPDENRDSEVRSQQDVSAQGQLAKPAANVGKIEKKVVIPGYGNPQMNPRARGAVTPQMGGQEEAPIQHFDENGNPIQPDGHEPSGEEMLTPEEQAYLQEQQQQSQVQQQTR